MRIVIAFIQSNPPPIIIEPIAIGREEQIRQQLNETVKIVQNASASEKDKKHALDLLTLYGDDAVDIIIDYLAQRALPDPVDEINPDYIRDLRNRLVETDLQVSDSLLSASVTIIDKSKSTFLSTYFKDLLSAYIISSAKEKKAFLAAFLYSAFDQPTQEYLIDLLNKTLSNQWDPVKRILLRGLLSNKNNLFTLTPKQLSKPQEDSKVIQAIRARYAKVSNQSNSFVTIFFEGADEAIGCKNTENREALIYHIQTGEYPSFIEEKNTDDVTVKTLMFEPIREKLNPCNPLYLFGFDFFSCPVYNLSIEHVLLGKSIFTACDIQNLRCNDSTLLECQLDRNGLQESLFSSTRFVNCLFNNSSHAFNVFVDTSFSDCNLAGEKAEVCYFIDSNFVSSNLNKWKLWSSFLLNCRFTFCETAELNIRNVIIDKLTLDSLSQCHGFDTSALVIQEVHIEGLDMTNFNSYYYTKENLYSPSPEEIVKQLLPLSGQCSLSESNKELIKKYLMGRQIFILNPEAGLPPDQ